MDAFDNEQCSSKDVVDSDVGNVAAPQAIGICIDPDNRDGEITSSTTFTDTAIQLRTCDVNGVANEQCNSNDAANIDNDNVVIGNDMQTYANDAASDVDFGVESAQYHLLQSKKRIFKGVLLGDSSFKILSVYLRNALRWEAYHPSIHCIGAIITREMKKTCKLQKPILPTKAVKAKSFDKINEVEEGENVRKIQ